MPRKSIVSREEIIDALLCSNDYFSSEGLLHPPSHPVWKAVSSELQNRLTPKYLWVMVRQNRNDFRDKISVHSNINSNNHLTLKHSELSLLPTTESDSHSSGESDSSISASSKPETIKPRRNFTLTISPKAWRELHPIERNWKSSGRLHGRSYLQFESGWTTKLIDMLWSQHRIPCPYTFKHLHIAKDSDTASHFLQIKAFCKECKSSAVGTMTERPLEGESSQIIWRAVDTRGVPHTKKRPIAGEIRKQLGNQVVNVPASYYRRTEAAKKMNFGEPEPPNLPSNGTIRKIKQEKRSQQLQLPNETDPISALIGMKYRHPYAGIIHEIAADKFMVSYHSPVQRRFYREFRRKNYTILALDATGSLVQKIRRPSGRSGHIFLYEAVVNTGKAQFPIFQLLSEKHDANTLCYWLNEWERTGQLSPQQVICDQSPALLSALARSFGKSASYNQYKESCFLAAITDSKDSLPSCFIRADISHFISLASKWPLWRNINNRRVKEFYMRCLGLLVKSYSLANFEGIIFDIFCCSLAETDGSVEGTNAPTYSETSRKQLLDWIEAFQVNLDESNWKKLNSTSVELEDVEEDDECVFSKTANSRSNPGAINDWISKIFQRATDLVGKEAGDRLSPYFSPPIAQKFLMIAHDFVVWSGVMVSLFEAPNFTATSAFVEGDFNDLKNRILQGDAGPLAAHKFVGKHIMAIEGAVLLASTEVVETPEKNDDIIDDELNCFENWKGQAVPPKKRRVPKYVVPCPEIKAVEEVQKLKTPSPSLQLLRNGNLSGLIKVDGVTTELKNTCSFDSICQIIALIYSESDKFRLLMEEQKNLTIQTAKCLALYGATTDTYSLRCKALATVLEEQCLDHPPGAGKSIVRYECYGNISNLVKKLFQDMPSMTVAHTCFNAPCSKSLKMNIKKHITLDVNSNILLEGGLAAIDLALASWMQSSDKSCCEEAEVNKAMGQMLFIDTDFLGIEGIGLMHRTSDEYNKECAIKDIPSVLSVEGEKFTLRGIVAYEPGHYIGYARHFSGQWDAHDDIAKHVIKAIKDDHQILPHLIVYSKY